MVVKFYDSDIGYDNMMFAFVTRFGLAHLLMGRNKQLHHCNKGCVHDIFTNLDAISY